LNDIVSKNKIINNPKRATTLSGYIFLPLAAVGNDYEVAGITKQGAVHAIYSAGGQSFIGVWDGDIILLSNEPISFNALKTWLDNFKAAFNANVTIVNNNNSAITSAWGSPTPPVLTPLNQYTADYRQIPPGL
jgi:hypothetical protein